MRQYGWYVRTCAHGPFAAHLRGVTLQQLCRLEGKDVDCEFDFMEPSRKKVSDAVRMRRLGRLLRQFTTIEPGEENLERTAGFAGTEFGLDAIDTEILLLMLRCERNTHIRDFADEAYRHLESTVKTVGALLGTDVSKILPRILAGRPLIDAGLVVYTERQEHRYGSFLGDGFRIAEHLRKAMHRPYATHADWVQGIVGCPLTTSLVWEEFAHLDPLRTLAAELISGATSEALGINVLVHGPVGTGKTEFCKALAARAGRKLWTIAGTSDEGKELGRDDRLAAFRLAQRLLRTRADAVILFDEAEDAFGCTNLFFTRVRSESKHFANHVLETNPVPVLWTCNDLDAFEPHVLRRMTLAMKVGVPPVPVRRTIWLRGAAATGLALGHDAASRLAGRYEAPPAVAANAMRAAMLAHGGEGQVELAMEGISEALGIVPQTSTSSDTFDLSLIECSEDVSALVERLARIDAPRDWSICIHGLPGTGKSAFVRYLAKRLELEVTQRRASDLLSKWVGDSEKQIAAAFATARLQRTFLVIDEAESLLRDRSRATHQWELTQVDEMLTWMENHPLPFACTTNLASELDPASLRRFALKLEFIALSDERARLAFERFFGQTAPRRLPDGLTPGDFATVRRKATLIGGNDPHQLVTWLEEEMAMKGGRVHPIGF
jgi:transitional endoplasmic reticulum ATPase